MNRRVWAVLAVSASPRGWTEGRRRTMGGRVNLPGPAVILLVCVFLAAAICAPATAQTTERVNVNTAGAEGNQDSHWPSIAADGRFVAFESWATNLVPGDTNEKQDIFVRDRYSGTTERVSVSSGGQEADGSCYHSSLSADGRYVAFFSCATNLVPNDTNGYPDIFVRDRETGTTERVSVSSAGDEAADCSYWQRISSDGSCVVFISRATNLVADDTNGAYDIFVRDRETGTTDRVSISTGGVQANDDCNRPSISADGRYVAFPSWASNLVADDTNACGDIFIRDRETGTTDRVSVSTGGTEGDYNSLCPAITPDGRFVAFKSHATNLVPGDTNGFGDIFVRDRYLTTTELVSVTSAGEQVNRWSDWPSISADGRYVAFVSDADTFVAGDTNGANDIFLHDRQTGTTERVSLSNLGTEANCASDYARISADGRFVAFESIAYNLVPHDTNVHPDIFVRSRGALSVQVDIDIKPGAYPNAINLSSQGLIPVAILSSVDFDALTVDPETVTLAGAGIAVRGHGSKYMAHQEDVNADGLPDLVVHVVTQNLDPGQFDAGYATVTGTTYGGQDLEGWDEIVIVPPE